MLKGTGASEGIGVGTIMLIEEVSLEYTPTKVEDPEQEILRFQKAVQEFIHETEAQAEALKASAGEKEAEIMLGHVSMIQDPYMTGEAERLIREGQCAEAAFESVSDMFINMFANVEDEMMRQRAADIRDIKSGLLAVLLGVKEVKVSDAPAGTVKKGEWTKLEGTYTAGDYDRSVLYVETTGAPQLSFEIKNFIVDAPNGIPKPKPAEPPMEIPAVAIEDMPSIREAYEGKFDFGVAVPQRAFMDAKLKALMQKQFSILTPENELKPDFVLDVQASKSLVRNTGDET